MKFNHILQIFFFAVLIQSYSCSSKSQFPSPVSNTGDLAWDGEYLWVAGTDEGRIYKLDFNGYILFSFICLEIGPAGLTWDGTNIWVSTISDKLMQYDTEGKLLRQFPAPGDEANGLAWANGNLYCVSKILNENLSTFIYRIDPGSGVITDSFEITDYGRYEGLAFNGIDLLVVESLSKELFRVDLESGEILERIELRQTLPEGITWDGKCLWITDLMDEKIESFVLR